MNRKLLHHAVTAIAMAASCSAVAADAVVVKEIDEPVAVRVEGLAPYLQDRIRHEARQGRTALRRYLHRTQFIHQLRPQYVIRDPQPVAAREVVAGTRIAERRAAPAD